MWKTADQTAVKKKVIVTLHKEDETQKVFAEEAACSECCVPAHQWKVEWEEEVWYKKLHSQRR